jgi:hypothetical protein
MAEMTQESIGKTAEDPRDEAQQLGALVRDLRSRRLPIEQSWLDFHKAWRGIRTRSWFKSEVFQNFIPAMRRAIEKNVIKVSQMLLPSPEFFEVFPADELDDRAGDAAESVRAFYLYLFAKKIKIKSLVTQLVRTYELYGRAIVKTGVKIEQIAGVKTVWPSARAVDPFTIYHWPETVPSYEDAVVIAEDNLMPYETWQSHVRAGNVINVPPVNELTEPAWPMYWGERLNISGMPSPSNTGGGTQPQKDGEANPPKFMAITEVYFLKNDAWEMRWLLWNCADGPRIVRRYTPVTGRHPYRGAIARQLPGEAYTTGMGDDLEPLQVLYNDQWNMTLEGQAMSFAPIAVIDPSLMGRSGNFKYAPRAKWFCDPQSTTFLQAPDTSKSGYLGLNVTMQLIESFSADNPISNGMPTRGMPRAGFAVSSMVNLAMADVKDAAQTIEDDILTPMMGDLFVITQLLVPEEQKFKIPGSRAFPRAQQLSLADLAGDYEFRWVGSLQSQDMQVRAQRLISTLGTLAKLQPFLQQDLATKGKRINWEGLLKRVWRDGLGERGADSIIVDMTPQEIQAMQAQQNQRPVPKVSVSLKGELDPLVSKDLAEGVDPRQDPATSAGPGSVPKAPTSDLDMERRSSRADAESARQE